MTDPVRSISARWLAIAALVCFAPVVASFALAPGAAWVRNYPGIVFHLCLFLLVAKLEAPEWAKAAGYGWLILDVMTGVLTLNGVPFEIYNYVRLGGHIFAGIWISMASLQKSRSIQIVGIVTGVYIAGYSFVSPFVPMKALGPNSLLWLVWLALIAWQDGRKVAAHGDGVAAVRTSYGD